jgi:hypothetical protein
MLCTPRLIQELTAEMDDHELHTRIDMKALNANMLDKVFESRPDFVFDAANWIETMENFALFINFLWTADSIIHQVALRLITVVKAHRSGINSMSRGNKYLIPTYIWKINNRIHSRLNSCKTASICSEANWKSIQALPEEIDSLLDEHERPMIELPFKVKTLVSVCYEKKVGSLKRGSPNQPEKLNDDHKALANGTPPKKPELEDDRPGVAKDPAKHNSKVPSEWKMEPKIFSGRSLRPTS